MNKSIEDSLRAAIVKSKLTHYELSKRTGVNWRAIDRFVHLERTIRLDTAAKIAKHLGLVLKQEK